jgi:formiminotetrahydrofolate cyclodeaminase
MAAVVGGLIQTDFIEELAATTPTPGGGSAAAYAGAMAAGLVSMVARLTIGKKGYQDQEKVMKQILEESEKLREELRTAVDQDAEAYNQVMAAYKKPKSDPERDDAVREATLDAARVPLEVAERSLRVIQLALEAARSGNSNAVSDAGSAVHLAYAALTSAAYNVRINVNGLGDDKEAAGLKKAIKKLEDQADDSLQQIKEILTERGGLF